MKYSVKTSSRVLVISLSMSVTGESHRRGPSDISGSPRFSPEVKSSHMTCEEK